MGRRSEYSGRYKPSRLSKAQSISREQKTHQDRISQLDTKTKATVGLLQAFAIDVLEAAAKEHVVDEIAYAEKIKGVLAHDTTDPA